ncbi:peptide ABC transporter substrate-binding protein [Paenibacillus sacheonensis]|uniref:Peptide ABC transporter substrate-binding protein n=1 Tax=Paenibacillus sacheonensis TaxID=742054 RepID=A0A7X4YMN0_9BACL|nr:peptide ABC transporter substrate-binding protein [Paenibacillus sacheonensis]MBM7564560.1 oligopeptide transport system substrate-binding protein [Paenibacillus sacheonensis]NBC69117.1 peptide ABC transporter substrate-binding protein [Paenibacillus sacheonensis]
MKKKMLLMASLMLVLTGVLSACGKSGSGDDQTFRMNLTSEPPSLDVAQAQDQVSFTVLNGLFEGLTRMDDKGNIVPGVAEKWDISEDGKTYTFHLRDNAKWSNGQPVKAGDFEYSWKRTLDPKLNPPAPYAYQLYYIKNAQNYNIEQDNPDHISDPSQVGVKALDDKTLEVQLENPTPYFLNIAAFFTAYPVLKDTQFAEAKDYVGNGPFKMKSWKHGDSIELVPNENYWDKDAIKLTDVKFLMIKDPNTEFNMYKTGQLDWAGAPTGSIPPAQLDKYKADKSPELSIKGIASTYYYNFNNTKKPFDNAKVRRALSMAINRQDIVDKVTKAGQVPAYGFVSTGIHGVNGEFRDEVKDDYFKEDVTEAKKLLAEGLAEEGMTKMPAFSLSFNEGLHKTVAEAIANMWKENLGIDAKLELQEWKVFLKNRQSLNYDVARAGWGADYNDPMTFIDMFTSKGGNNDIGFKNADYDALVKEAYSTNDQQKRVDAMAKAEKILIGDNTALMPIYYYSSTQLIKPYVKNYVVDYSGNIDYTHITIEK